MLPQKEVLRFSSFPHRKILRPFSCPLEDSYHQGIPNGLCLQIDLDIQVERCKSHLLDTNALGKIPTEQLDDLRYHGIF